MASAVMGEMRFNVRTLEGRPMGTAVLSPVALSGLAPATTMRPKMLGNVPLASLRRTVIDLMITEGGWVVNDMEREMGGRRVFMVLAQSGGTGMPRMSWVFYFLEIDGRLYKLATTAPLEFAAPLAADSEQVLASFGVRGTGPMSAQTLR